MNTLSGPQRWEIEFTAQAEDWFMKLKPDDADRIAAAFDALELRGPALGRPFVDSIKGSRHHNMKELRSIGSHLRALFAFDPQRRAIVLVGGDKSDDWQRWYERNIPRADARYDDHLRGLGRSTGCHAPRAGGKSADRGR
ncbi:MAG TPA: type II toxin-antitoxin system RelE/ParE family toxin [Solirubrobacteraceae bacterium]|jgi:hypothetical protein|nr:type II toxin-antitoxin system RelE/ParE family toxin [Solirubrobacteraceae bacterium]